MAKQDVVFIEHSYEDAQEQTCTVCGRTSASYAVQVLENKVYREASICATCMYMLTIGRLKTNNKIVSIGVAEFAKKNYTWRDRFMFWWLPKRDWVKYRFHRLAKR